MNKISQPFFYISYSMKTRSNPVNAPSVFADQYNEHLLDSDFRITNVTAWKTKAGSL